MTENEVLDLLSQASGVPVDEIRRLWKIIQTDDAEMNRLMKADWNQSPRKTPEEIRKYYETSVVWLANEWNHGRTSLMALASDDGGSLSPGEWISTFTQDLPRGGSILDYGGGLWNTTASLVFSGYRVTQAEIKGPVTRFLRAFRERVPKGELLQVLDVDTEFPVADVYDAVVCFEVLEHLLRPKEFVKHLYDHLRPGGTLAVSTSFSEPEYAPYHMHANLAIPGVWNKVMGDVGFRIRHVCSDSPRWIWVKP